MLAESNIDKFYNDAHTVSENMQKFGGSFVQALGLALVRADVNNMHKIKNTFPQYWDEYLNWGIK